MDFKKKGVLFTLLMVFTLASLVASNAPSDDYDKILEKIRKEGPQYQYEEQVVNFRHMDMNIVCTLTTPKANRSRPIILLVHGFLGERHGAPLAGTEEGYHDRFAKVLAMHGFCVLRPDFRGSGESDGTFDITTFTGQRSDSIAALDFIETLPDPVNPDVIGMAGHSQGGLVTAITAVADDRVKSVALLAATAHPAHDFENLLLPSGMWKGISAPPGTVMTFPVYVNGVYLMDTNLSREFIAECFSVSPLAAMALYEGPMMYVAPLKDVVVWPQPRVGVAFMEAHTGLEQLTTVDSGHNFSYMDGPQYAEEVAQMMAAWFILTLK